MIGIFHDITLKPGAKPSYERPYKLSPLQMSLLKEEMDKMLKDDIIEPSQSEWQGLWVMVKKKDGSYRVAQDF